MANQQLSTRHLLGIKYITPDDIDLIFETTDQFKEVINRPIKKVPSLRDVTIANLFLKIQHEHVFHSSSQSDALVLTRLILVQVHRRSVKGDLT